MTASIKYSLYFIFLFLFMAIIILGGCGKTEDQAPGTAGDYRQQLESTQEELRKVRSVGADCRAQVSALSVNVKDGLYMAEKSKAMSTREAELSRKEKILIEKSKENDQFFSYLKSKEAELYENTRMTLTDIGEAKQIKKEYENMRHDKISAENTKDNWMYLFFTFFILILFLTGFLVYSITNYKTRSKELSIKSMRINTALNYIDSEECQLPDSEKSRIANNLLR